MKIQTTRFGEIEFPDGDLIRFPEGILGFAPLKLYVLVDTNAESPLKWLQSCEMEDLAFVVCDPRVFLPGYMVPVRAEDLEMLELKDLTSALVMVIMNIPDDPRRMTANLKGPIVVNPGNMRARQMVINDPEVSTRFRVIPDEAEAAGGAGEEGRSC